MIRLPSLCLATAALAICPLAASAQSYPAKPVRIVVPFPPGGGADIFARLLAQKLNAAWNEQVVVDNRPGAGGMVGCTLAARAAPDGYTLLLTTIDTLAIIPHLNRKPPYDPLRDFSPIVQLVSAPNVLVLHPSVPTHSVKELVALAKARPGALNYASNGVGTLSHLTGELFKLQTGTNIVHVPYNGGPPAVLGVVTGQASMLFTAVPTALPLVRAGKLRALAISSPQRIDMAKELPAIAETLPGFESVQRFFVLGPAGLPADLVVRIHRDVTRMLGDADVKASFAAQGAEAVGSTTAEFAAYIKTEYDKWGKVITAAGVQID